MKKLIIAAAIVCAAVAAQADLYHTTWTVTGSGIKDYAGNAYSGEAAIYLDGVYMTGVGVTDGSISAYCGQDWSSSYGSHKLMITFNDGDRTYSEESWGVSEEDYEAEYYDDEEGLTTHDGEGSVTFNGSGSWTGGPADVPEPTSGLLMLIGMGALALKRKRA